MGIEYTSCENNNGFFVVIPCFLLKSLYNRDKEGDIMRILRLNVRGAALFKEDLLIDFTATQNVRESHKDRLHFLFENRNVKIYTNNVIPFAGINASGKTTVLKTLDFAISMLNGESLNSIDTREIMNNSDQDVEITAFLYDEKDKLYKIDSRIRIDQPAPIGEGLTIIDERIWVKNISQVKSKKNVFEFSDNPIKERVNEDSEYIQDDISISVAVTKKNKLLKLSLVPYTNINIIHILGEIPREILTYLDPSIEYINFTKESKEIKIKFYDKEEITVSNPVALENYLSSGTIKGINVFYMARVVFDEGGYLVIDELENHFNKEIAASLIRFFINNDINRNGATLIYSTHYVELLDEIERNDSIYIVRNKGGIYVEGLHKLLKRNDIKKSEAFESDYLGNTAPSYDAYMGLKKYMSLAGGGIL